MNADERLTCAECGGEGRLVRINRHLVRMGHIANPRDRMHPFTIARHGVDSQRRHAWEREDAPSLIANGTRAARKGRVRTAFPLGSSKSPEQERSQQDPSPAPAPAQGFGPR